MENWKELCKDELASPLLLSLAAKKLLCRGADDAEKAEITPSDWSDTFEHHACEINDSDQEEADLEDGLRLRFKRIG